MASAQLNQVLRYLRSLGDTQSLAEASDGQLLERFASQREEPAFGALLRRHGPMVLGVSQRVLHRLQDAEDVFQATFLLLARKARSIRKPESVSSWLHGVAHRLAIRAKEQRMRRQDHERRAANMRTAHSEPTWSEVQTVLDTALAALPEKYRSALVLCYLEGKSHAEAAQMLGCPLTTFRTRVARGRALLRDRLTRQGLTLSTAGLVTLLLASAAPAAAPAALVKATLKAAVPFAAGQTAATLCSTPVAGLVEGGLKAMFLTKVKSGLAVLLAVSVLAGAGLVAHRRLAADESTQPQSIKEESAKPQAGAKESTSPKGTGQKAELPKDDLAGAVEFSGRVLDPDGKPFAGAKLHLITNTLSDAKTLHLQTTGGPDGGFRIQVPAAESRFYADEASWSGTCILATAKGFGPGVAVLGAFESKTDLTLRLAKDDVPINGRVVDLQGRPLAGVQVHVNGIAIPSAGTLTPWLEALEANKQDGYPIESRFLVGASLPPAAFPNLISDEEGRFHITGVGRERLVRLTIQGPAIVISRVSVMTRPSKPIHAAMFARNPEGGSLTYYGATFEHPAAPSRPIIGLVRDKDSGKPIPGVPIQSDKFAGVNVSGDSSVRTVTDKDGRYRLVGMPKGEGNSIKAAPAVGQPYLQSVRSVEDSPGLEPVTVDFDLKRGVMVKGRVLDKATQKPVFANVHYLAFADNPWHKNVPGWAVEQYLQTGEDGTFQLVVLPGRGLLTARGWGDHYRMAVGADRFLKKDRYGDNGEFLLTAPYLCHPTTVHTLVEINPDEKALLLACDIILDPGTMPHGTITGPGGKPVAGTKVFGLTAYGQSRNWTRAALKSAEFTVYGLDVNEEREVVFVHESKHLVGVVRVRGDSKKPITVKLEPWGTVTGRLVTAEGTPRPGVLLRIADAPVPNSELQSDKDGRFRAEGLAPGMKYTMEVIEKGNAVARVFTALSLKAGEVKDLGDLQPKKIETRSTGE